MSNIFSWGKSNHGQLGLEQIDKCCVAQIIPRFSSSPIDKICCSSSHTLFLLKNGKLYSCGNNDYKQLGHDSIQNKPSQIQMLDGHRIIDISSTYNHNAAVTDNGQLFTWGRNANGELGRSQYNDYSIKMVQSISNNFVVQVACGSDHTMALTRSSDIYTWGANDSGQLGLGTKCEIIHTPQKVPSLSMMPIKYIRTGDKFSLIVTPSGSLYSWGVNIHGQLGRETTSSDAFVPQLIKHLRKQSIAYVSVGESHVAALSMDGGVFTWGFGKFGQLGHNNFENKCIPCKVMDLMGSIVNQVECGMNHTLAYVKSTGVVYSFGQGVDGQLGVNEFVDHCHTPRPIKGPWISCDVNNISKINRQITLGDVSPHVVKRLFAGGNHSMMLADEKITSPQLNPVDLRLWDWRHPSNISTVNSPESNVESCVKSLNKSSDIIFSSMACLSSCFLEMSTNSAHISKFYHGLNVELSNDVFTKFLSLQSTHFLQHIAMTMREKILCYTKSTTNYPNLECLRFFLIIVVSGILEQSQCSDILLLPFSYSLSIIHKTPSIAIDCWLGDLKPRYFKKICLIFITAASSIINSSGNGKCKKKFLIVPETKSIFECVQKLHNINEEHNRIIDYTSFYISNISKVLDLERLYESWLKNPIKTDFSIFNYPFLFDGLTKSNMIKIEAKCMMSECSEYALIFGIPFEIGPRQTSYHITVQRKTLLADTINQLMSATQNNLKKPFRVNFMGEDALDEGGVMKELFLLIVPEVLNPDYGLFEMFPESRLCWFNRMTFEDNFPHFNAIGRLCGLAIYNNVMMDLHFPLAMFKKLLNETVTLDDLIELNPTMGRSLQSLLDYDLPDFEDNFMLNFMISLECYGEKMEIELVPDGAIKTVTLQNRHEYIDLYVDYILNKNMEQPFKHFKDGFHFTMQGLCLKFFKPVELQELLVGSENFDWTELRKSCTYLGEYWNNHEIINWFWESLFSLNLNEKKQFLRFLTGCDRVPINGMSDIKLKIQPVNLNDSHLPVAHTCYNLLDLPKYSSKSTLKVKLQQAIAYNEGFALV